MRAERRWTAAVREHDAALGAFIGQARTADETEWQAARPGGAWSRAQITEHLALGYEALLDELAGGPGLAPRAARWQQRLLRWLLLPHVLFHRSIPGRAPAPKEMRPAAILPDREAQLERLRELGDRFARELRAARAQGGGKVGHPYFGKIPPARALRFCAIHIEHHTRQLSE